MKITLQWDKPKPASLKISYESAGAAQLLSRRLSQSLERVSPDSEIIVLCVGTDRSTGDALGPLVGTALTRNMIGFPVYGTLQEPVHAMNLRETMDRIRALHREPYTIAVDACLGHTSSVGCIQIAEGPVKPGAGVNKELPPVGDVHITGIVNVSGFMEYFVLQNTRLCLVVDMAEVIADAIRDALARCRSVRALISGSVPD